MTWRDDNRPTSANLGISNEAIIEEHGLLKLVQSSYNEETWTHSVPLNIEVVDRNGAVAQSDSYQNVVFVEIMGALLRQKIAFVIL